MKQGANEQTYCLMVTGYKCPWKLTTPEMSQVHCWPLEEGEE